MSQQQQENAPQQKKSPTAKEMFQASVTNASRVLENTDTVSGTPGLITEGALLGVCIVFLAAMLSLQKLDTPLTIALFAFSFAIPLLSCSVLYGIYKPRPVPGHLVLEAILIGAWIAGGVGQICVVVGVFFVILHVSTAASMFFVAATVSVVVLIPLFALIGLIIYGIILHRKEQRAKQTATEPENKEK